MKPVIKFYYLDYSGCELDTELPDDCINDCSAGGRVDAAVSYWVDQFTWDVAPGKVASYLKSTGGWEAEDLADHDTNLQRLLWLICCDISEERAQA